MRPWAVLLLLLPLAGCVSDGDGPDEAGGLPEVDADGAILHDNVATNIGTPIHVEHEGRALLQDLPDHTHASDHTGSHNLDFVGWSSLGATLGDNGFANFVLHDTPDGRTLAFIAVDGDAVGGFTIADVTDPTNMVHLGDYRASGSGFQEVRVTPDGRHAILNVQDIPAPASLAGGLGACSICMHVVDVSDPSNPSLESVFPVEVQGTHNMDLFTDGGTVYVVHVGQPLGLAGNDPVGNRLGVLQLVETPIGAILVPVGYFAHPALLDAGRSFPHDVLVQQHPDGTRVAYVSHWDGGVVTFDLTNPSLAIPLGVNNEMAPSSALAIHWTIQEEARRADGKVYAWSVPEIGELDDGTGVVRAYDATDPSALRQVGTWQLPGNATINAAGAHFILSPHVVQPDLERGLLAVAHYHAGVWVLDISDPTQPRALGYYLPHGDPTAPYDGPFWWKKPNFDPAGFLPNAYMVRWHGDLLWASERGSGLYALRYTGPVPGPVA